jgi:hypothetical protein
MTGMGVRACPNNDAPIQRATMHAHTATTQVHHNTTSLSANSARFFARPACINRLITQWWA